MATKQAIEEVKQYVDDIPAYQVTLIQAIDILIQQAEKMEKVRELNSNIGKCIEMAGRNYIITDTKEVLTDINDKLSKIINE